VQGRQEVPESGGMLLSRLHALQIAHHPELAFPHDRLPDPTKKEFCLAFS